MLKKIFTDLIGSSIIASGRAIKVYNLNLYSKYNFDITPEQYVVLNMLKDEERLNQNKLCKLLYKDKSNMARLISVLEEKELIKKTPENKNGKQTNIITITQKGKDLRDKITPIMTESRKNYLEDISQDDMYTCIKVLSKIAENLQHITEEKQEV